MTLPDNPFVALVGLITHLFSVWLVNIRIIIINKYISFGNCVQKAGVYCPPNQLRHYFAWSGILRKSNDCRTWYVKKKIFYKSGINKPHFLIIAKFLGARKCFVTSLNVLVNPSFWRTSAVLPMITLNVLVNQCMTHIWVGASSFWPLPLTRVISSLFKGTSGNFTIIRILLRIARLSWTFLRQ